MTYEEIVKPLEAWRNALADEALAVRMGQKHWPEYAPILARHSGLFTKETITGLQEEIARTMDVKLRGRMERALFALLEGMIAVRSLPLEEALAREMSRAHAVVDNDRIAFDDFYGLIVREPDPKKRERLRAAQGKLLEPLTQTYLDREHAVRQALSAFGFSSCREYAETKKGVRFETLLEKTIPVLQETTGLYRRVMSDAIRKSYGAELGDVDAVHAQHWRAGLEVERFFPADRLLPQCGEALAGLGLDLKAAPAVVIDADNLNRKKARSWHVGVRVPEDVRIVLKPRAGVEEYRAFLHEAGHALHLSRTDAGLPFELRALSRSDALSETYATLLAHLLQNPLWLEHGLKLPKAAADRVAAWSLLMDLYMLRRRIAKFTYELAFDDKPYDLPRNKELYARTLLDLTGFRNASEWFLKDRDDAFFGSADTIRAAIASAQLEEHLVRKFGDRWFLKRESGSFLKELFAKGVSWGCEEMVASLGMSPLDPLPLIRKFDGVSKLLR